MKKQFTILSILVFAVFGCFTLAWQVNAKTEVGGIINSNTTWTLNNSPYIMIDTVQIPVGVTLTIEPGVVINKHTDGDMFLIAGTIYAHGIVDNKIIFDGGDNSDFFSITGSGSAFLDLKYCIVRNGLMFWPGGNHNGHFYLQYSELINLAEQSTMAFPSGNIDISYNKFIDTYGFRIDTDNDIKVNIKNNFFYKGHSIGNTGYWNFYITVESQDSSKVTIKYNSFINMNDIVLKLGSDSINTFSATENYWGTQDINIIESMVYDRNDDIGCAGYINYLPILTSFHFDTPTFTTCTSWTYSDWSLCLSNNQQTRSIVSFSPAGCVDGNPVLSQSCEYIPPTCNSWTYSNWSSCSSSGQQTRSIISSSPNGCSEGNSILTQICIYVSPVLPTCTSWIYSNWNDCINGQQTRNVISSSPKNCIDGNPILSQTCQIDVANKFLDNKSIINEIKLTVETLSEMLFNSDELLGVDQININDNFEDKLGVKDISIKYEAINSYNLVKKEINKLKELNLTNNNEQINDAIKLTKNTLLLMDKNLIDIINLLDVSIISYDHPDIIDLKYFETTYNTNSLSVKSKIDIFNDGHKIFLERNKLEIPNQYNSLDSLKNEGNSQNIIKEEKSLITKIDKNLSKRMSGNILLQVEKNGEGWYVSPANQKKYYLGRPVDAFNIMRNLGLGITHSELNNYINSTFPSRLSGKIMLDVEQNGEAYYVNPNNLKGYYLNRPADAFRIMREFGLGITNNDIRKIDMGLSPNARLDINF